MILSSEYREYPRGLRQLRGGSYGYIETRLKRVTQSTGPVQGVTRLGGVNFPQVNAWPNWGEIHPGLLFIFLDFRQKQQRGKRLYSHIFHIVLSYHFSFL